MILHALNQYYERLNDDPDVAVPRQGFSRQKIAFCVSLAEDGTSPEIQDMRAEQGGRLVPQSLVVPGGAKPSGQGINPGFLWDNTAYMLGVKPEDPKPERTRESYEAFRRRHLDAEAEIADPEFSAVCRFLEEWQPAGATEHPILAEPGLRLWSISRQHSATLCSRTCRRPGVVVAAGAGIDATGRRTRAMPGDR